MAEEVPTAQELAKLRVVDLKEKLTELGLPTNGIKATLVEVGSDSCSVLCH